MAGKQMPIDPDPHPDGTVVPVDVNGQRRAKVLRLGELSTHVGARFRAHWTWCPHSDAHRKR
jgi:hypothetical protein